MKLRDFLDIDFSLFLASVILTVFGILFIYSPAFHPPEPSFPTNTGAR
jgi:cell division protein FtsW (lipid II flippase)